MPRSIASPKRTFRRIQQTVFAWAYDGLRALVALACPPLFRVRRVGRPPRLPEGGVVLCANHASYLDPIFAQLVVARRLTFMMTSDFYRRSWGRWFFKLVGAIPVGKGRRVHRSLRRAMALVRLGHAVMVFPEGRLTRDGRAGRARRGIAILARRTGAPVVPVGIAGSRRAWAYGERRPHAAQVRILFGEPLRWPRGDAGGPSTKGRQQAFADLLMERIVGLKEQAAAGTRSRLEAA